MEKIKIGNVEFKSRAVLAPMAGVTDRAYRELCVEFGAAYCVSEMVSSKALSFNRCCSNNKRSLCKAKTP